jgi:hypothetical protein
MLPIFSTPASFFAVFRKQLLPQSKKRPLLPKKKNSLQSSTGVVGKTIIRGCLDRVSTGKLDGFEFSVFELFESRIFWENEVFIL